MKSSLLPAAGPARRLRLPVLLLMAAAAFCWRAGAQTPAKPADILGLMQRVAGWQLEHPGGQRPTDWVAAAGDAGFMALAGISGDTRYREAMLQMAQSNRWEIGPHHLNADDECIGQTYTELYLIYRDPRMIAPLRRDFDAILARPAAATSLDFSQGPAAREEWSWCDSLFMAPPAWLRLAAVTDDPRYLDFAVTNWWRTTDYLYDRHEHLFYRDSTYFKKTEANGRPVFWGRGNGWVMAGLARMLQFLPMNHPDRPRFERLFQQMAEAVLACQQADGLWRASLLDPTDYPLEETSGSGFFTYALAWGVNQKLLDRTRFEPAAERGWAALAACVNADGKLTKVQPVGSDPRQFSPDSTAPYGVGAFLLAGSEMYRLAVLADGPGVGTVRVTNPAAFARDAETVEVPLAALAPRFQHADMLAVMDGMSARLLASQCYARVGTVPDTLLFQVDLAPGESRSFYVIPAASLPATPAPVQKTFARRVPSREDDFAWESDRIAHRMYGKALETWKAEPLTSSGVDVWIKRTRHLVVDDMYRTMKLFNTNGPSQDDYRVGRTRGCGGLGVWQDGRLYVSRNWQACRVLTSGPIRAEFELDYAGWDAGGRQVSETKRISIDAGSSLSRVQSTFQTDNNSPLNIGVGLTERPGQNIEVTDGDPMIAAWVNSTARGLVVRNQAEGWMTYWQPQDFAKGTTAVAIILPKGQVAAYTNDNPKLPASAFAAPKKTVGEGQPALRDFLAIAPARPGRAFDYYLGAGWDESVDYTNAAAWNDYVRRFAERRDQPLVVSVAN